ncbi:MAG: methyl-accepting chemotaxis protein [Aromatoleum sp.]|jgi:methyl-accepting chemotaxis protein|uniref:methyl-accepting chemotaxis protein n=1 Tax=Aromatoleum sp. TaxID=2307007 RepID=UPI002894325F|nr:methyl-accepting chemotaxis protein [Aromatoleum sp.]MDT3671706.1 methyl-accepting chemotaxis protein [Aromatoleum sp.]
MLVLVSVAVAASVVISVSSLLGMRELSALQHQGHDRSVDALHAQEVAGIAVRLYRVVADTVINRNFEESKRAWEQTKRQATGALDRLEASVDTVDERTWVAAVRKAEQDLARLHEGELLPLLQQPEPDLATVRALDERIDTLVSAIEADLAKVSASFTAEADDADAGFEAVSDATVRRNVILALAALIVLALVAAQIVQELLKQLGGEPSYAAKVVARIAGGDLSSRIEVAPGAEHSLLASMKSMQESLADLIGRIQDSATRVSASAIQLSSAAEQVMAASQQQSDSASSMSAAVEQMTVSIGQVADSATDASHTATRAGELSVDGAAVVRTAGDEIHQIADAVARTGVLMEALGEQSKKITMVVNVIREIADQTNLLALNAAIEAARAGEQGRGFAVVADEVRKLAERTSTSTTEIAAMVDSIQHSTAEATQSMSRGRERVDNGVALAGDAGQAIARVQESAGKVVVAVTDISNALEEQRSASTQIARGVEHIAQMTEESNAATAQIAEATGHLEHLASALAQMTERFRLAAAR